ncbi:hypothetical protein [Aeromicrobium sp.]|uniref:hypothetical protein n=1 Tax=Aeromicrobium sp. TaxID=1871063 RepID=UPI0019B339C6|nr:hypothetical protein [Aeromicrobium sp.]MBC7631706.1 hypothetical protein [Aeromicrobium sp.]
MIASLSPLFYSPGPAALLLVLAVVFVESGLLVGFSPRGHSNPFLVGAPVVGPGATVATTKRPDTDARRRHRTSFLR